VIKKQIGRTSVTHYQNLMLAVFINQKKWSTFSVNTFNENHKIVDVDEYFDVTGAVQAAIAPKK
jgi:hypothetical protein